MSIKNSIATYETVNKAMFFSKINKIVLSNTWLYNDIIKNNNEYSNFIRKIKKILNKWLIVYLSDAQDWLINFSSKKEYEKIKYFLIPYSKNKK